MRLIDAYRKLESSARLDQARAERIVAEAMPEAAAALGRPKERLPVRVVCVEPRAARGGSLIPAWPRMQPNGDVVIEYVADWGVLLAGWLSAVDALDRQLACTLAQCGQRVWIGIANDVLQEFVPGPPSGSYSMVRHHALMLAAATTWLGSDAIAAWRTAHTSAARGFLRRHARSSLWSAIEAAENGLATVLRDECARLSAPRCLEWLDADTDAQSLYVEFLSAASLGVAAVLDALESSGEGADQWIAHAVAELHPRSDFNRDWIERTARHISTPQADTLRW